MQTYSNTDQWKLHFENNTELNNRDVKLLNVVSDFLRKYVCGRLYFAKVNFLEHTYVLARFWT